MVFIRDTRTRHLVPSKAASTCIDCDHGRGRVRAVTPTAVQCRDVQFGSRTNRLHEENIDTDSLEIRPRPPLLGIAASVGDRDRDRLRTDRSSPRLSASKIEKIWRRSRSVIEIERSRSRYFLPRSNNASVIHDACPKPSGMIW